jgi:hypothetical protein
LLLNSTAREILADGKDFARLQVYFIDPQGKAAPDDIKVWLSWSNGELSSHPLTIKKGESSSETLLTSRSPGEAQVSLVSSSPAYAVDGDGKATVSFDSPIYGIKSLSPNPLVLSLIDCQPLIAQFFDENGHTVQTSKPRPITFSSSTSVVHLEPPSQDVGTNETGAAAFIVPTRSGRSTLEISTPGYEPQTLVVEITMWQVLALCFGGGIVGGIAARGKQSASLAWRAFTGVIGAIVLVWLCVFAVLPQTQSMVAHNHVSAFVVSIVGGYGGTRVLQLILRKLPLPA